MNVYESMLKSSEEWWTTYSTMTPQIMETCKTSIQVHIVYMQPSGMLQLSTFLNLTLHE